MFSQNSFWSYIAKIETDMWHERLSHLNYKVLNKISTAELVRGLPKLGKKLPGLCESCQHAK